MWFLFHSARKINKRKIIHTKIASVNGTSFDEFHKKLYITSLKKVVLIFSMCTHPWDQLLCQRTPWDLQVPMDCGGQLCKLNSSWILWWKFICISWSNYIRALRWYSTTPNFVWTEKPQKACCVLLIVLDDNKQDSTTTVSHINHTIELLKNGFYFWY